MVVVADEPDADDRHGESIENLEVRIANPQNRHYRANRRHMPGRESGESRPAMKGVEAVHAVADERRIVAHPGFRPGSSESEFELDLDRLRDGEARALEHDD